MNKVNVVLSFLTNLTENEQKLRRKAKIGKKKQTEATFANFFSVSLVCVVGSTQLN